jgi:putative SOS response-associated peptidase YedK
MCGRYVTPEAAAVERAWHIGRRDFDLFRPSYNVSPTAVVPILRRTRDSSELELTQARWGLIPAWAKDKSIGAKLINARAEQLAAKPAFRAALKWRRCLVPMRGFYEWQHTPHGRAPHYVHLLNDDVFACAGLWERWQSPEGEKIASFTIITTDANALVSRLHDRMPAILAHADQEAWLDLNGEDERLAQLLAPYPPDEMAAYPVSVKVNNSRNDGPELIEPIAAPERVD